MPKLVQAIVILLFCFAAVIIVAFVNARVMPYLSANFAVGWAFGAGTCLLIAFFVGVLAWDFIYNAWTRRE